MKDITDTVNDVSMLIHYQMAYNYVHNVSCMVGYCLYGALLLCLCWTACPVQIKAHHHTDFYAAIDDFIQNITVQMFHVVVSRF